MAADASILLTTLTTSGITVAAINWLKNSPLAPWVTKQNIWLLRILSAGSAVAASVGIHWVWTANDHTLVITGLTLSAIVGFFWHLIQQFTANEIVFQATKASSNPAVVAKIAPEAADPVAAKNEP